MSANQPEEDDENAILLEDCDGDGRQKQSVQINAADEAMLLLSSSPSPPSSPSAGIDENIRTPALNAGSSVNTSKPPAVIDLNTSLGISNNNDNNNIVIEDSDSERESSMNSNSIEVIGSDYEDDEDDLEESDSDESMGAYLDGKVQIFMAQGAFFIWDAEDVHMLREECRIVGKLVGCLPRAPCQNNQLGLPLQLMPEEAKLLEEIEACCVVEEVDALPDGIIAVRKSTFEAMRKDNYKVQRELYKQSRKEEVLQHKNVIIEGKKAKKRKKQQLESSEGKSVKSQKIENATSAVTLSNVQEVSQPGKSNITAGSAEDSNVLSCSSSGLESKPGAGARTKSGFDMTDGSRADEGISLKDNDGGGDDDVADAGESWKGNDGKEEEDGKDDNDEDEGDNDGGDDDFDVDELVTGETHIKHSLIQLFTENPWKENVRRPKQWIFPLSQKEFLRYQVFRDLWKKGYFLTCGSKFGGDFLVYPGDPARFHSHFIAVCIDKTVDLSALDIISLGRLGSNVRKTVLLCALDESRQVVYTSLQWTGLR